MERLKEPFCELNTILKFQVSTSNGFRSIAITSIFTIEEITLFFFQERHSRVLYLNVIKSPTASMKMNRMKEPISDLTH